MNNEVFIHILSNPSDVRNHYVPIEPSFAGGQEEILEKVEEHLADFVDELEGITDAAKRLEIIMSMLDRLVSVRNGGKPVSPGNGTINRLLKRNGNGKTKITVTPLQYRSLRYMLKRKLEGMGLLDPMICDTNIEDISCSGLGHIFVEHKVLGGLKSSIGFDTHIELDKFVVQLAEGIKHPVTFREPCVDATLPDGSRINIVYGTDVSKRGSNFTIRKFSETPRRRAATDFR